MGKEEYKEWAESWWNFDICNVITGNHNFDTFAGFINEISNFIIWQYSIIYILWPQGMFPSKHKYPKPKRVSQEGIAIRKTSDLLSYEDKVSSYSPSLNS